MSRCTSKPASSRIRAGADRFRILGHQRPLLVPRPRVTANSPIIHTHRTIRRISLKSSVQATLRQGSGGLPARRPPEAGAARRRRLERPRAVPAKGSDVDPAGAGRATLPSARIIEFLTSGCSTSSSARQALDPLPLEAQVAARRAAAADDRQFALPGVVPGLGSRWCRPADGSRRAHRCQIRGGPASPSARAEKNRLRRRVSTKSSR